MVLDLKDLICIIFMVGGTVFNYADPAHAYLYKAFIIAGIVGFIAIHIYRWIIRIKDVTNPDKMPPPKNRRNRK